MLRLLRRSRLFALRNDITLRGQILRGPFDVMLLQGLASRCAIGGPACQLVIVINSGIDFLVSQSEARSGTSALQGFEKFLWQFVVFSSKSLAGIKRPEEIQA